MSRRTKRSTARKANPHSSRGGQPASDGSPDPPRNCPLPNPPRPNKWFLAAAVLLQAGWIGFLIAMALSG